MKIVFLVLFGLRLSLGCQNITEADCPSPGGRKDNSFPCVCSRLPNRTDTVVCCNINTLYKYNQGLACGEVEKYSTKHLHIFNYTLENFDASSSKWRHLESLSVTGSKFKGITGQFRGDLKCVNFSSNSLVSIDNTTFTNLSNLVTLDLSNNSFTGLPDLPSLDNRNLTLDISGNQNILCKYFQHLFTMEPFSNLHIRRVNETFCIAPPKIFHWFNSTVQMSWDHMVYRHSVEKECPSGPNYHCNCSFLGMDLVLGQPPTSSVQVDCSGRQLTELPKLPIHTIHLNVSNNNISSLDKFINDSSYGNLRFFLADNNKIDNFKCLEGSQFIYGFQLLSLRENKIKSIPTYLFSRVFDSPLFMHAKKVFLAGNRLNCDCNTAQSVKRWLIANRAQIADYDQIVCDKEGLGRVIDLDTNQVCIYQKDWSEYIYYIIAGEILLLVLLVSKVSYDYWVFKTSGYLPWPASKMPKLPCDWVFET